MTITGSSNHTITFGDTMATAVFSDPPYLLCGCGRYVSEMIDMDLYACECGRLWRVTVVVEEIL